MPVVLASGEVGNFHGIEKVISSFGVHVRHNTRSQQDEIYFPADFDHDGPILTGEPLGVYMMVNSQRIPCTVFEYTPRD